jgi:hypothetical protein
MNTINATTETKGREAIPECSPARSLARLQFEAGGWIGTPWCANSAVKGPRGGVACHRLPREIYVAAGWLPQDFPIVSGSPNEGRHEGASPIADWLDGRREFERVLGVKELREKAVGPGSLLGFRLGSKGVGHLGVMLTGMQFIHVLQHKHTAMDRIDDPTWLRRLEKVWVPVWEPREPIGSENGKSGGFEAKDASMTSWVKKFGAH